MLILCTDLTVHSQSIYNLKKIQTTVSPLAFVFQTDTRTFPQNFIYKLYLRRSSRSFSLVYISSVWTALDARLPFQTISGLEFFHKNTVDREAI